MSTPPRERDRLLEDISQSDSARRQATYRSTAPSSALSHEDQLQRDLHIFRFKYIFNQSCSDFCQSVKRRLPSGTRVYVVLLMLGLEQVAFTAAIEVIIAPFLAVTNLRGELRPLVRSVGLNLVANLLFPITGWLADVWVGRYRMIHLSSWVMWLGYCLAAFSISFQHFGYNHWNAYILLPCYIVINIGSAGFQANAIPFGADQIFYKTSHELSSYFYMYYWMRNLGSIMIFLIVRCQGIGFDKVAHSLTYVGIGVLASTLIICLNAIFRSSFIIHNKRRNPLKTVFKVLYSCAITKRPMYRSAFSYTGVSQPSRIDLTKTVHGGEFEEETVEDVKTFLRLVVVLLPLLIILIAYTGITAVTDVQILSISSHYQEFIKGCKFSSSLAWSFNILIILLLIPIINHCLLPFLREYAPTMLRKIGTGIVVLLLSLTILLSITVARYLIEHKDDQDLTCMFKHNRTSSSSSTTGESPLSLWVLVLPYFFVSLAEIFINVSSEFVYHDYYSCCLLSTQGPH